ncbi:diversity-generating retroelement protein Avd [Vibrio vulnificus]|uniref:diversity-generating retroelement protein Avd n=1 Tax=Vibrionaceae TaxID=641 RepID=UPI001023B69E|nr:MULTISPECIES: diversity-generating retroelement protein Avd [Vibrionaceae]MCU8190151.1 diversity-generating retroelement protein Avd [Vibrio vulnificus]RZP97181.1 diversity-generating retroelement protein Avd [Vibrio vulnificus]RZQ44350.1 diversity-generating retroelement protein Avd [Vibrio vulnificus]TLS65154.1 diversity-generating retroelement protein Avd [Photobacterium damselae subsp. damselae]
MTALVIEEKCREMLMYGYQALKQFPKHEKHVLGAEIRLSMLQLQRLIVTAFKRYHKKTTLTDLDIELAILKRRVRLAKDLRYLDLKKYQIWIGQLVEIGKMIGGWIKSIKTKTQATAL